MGSIILIDDFTADQVPRHFNLAPDQNLERMAMRFVFHGIKRELTDGQEDPSTTEVVQAAIRSIEPRHHLLHSYKNDFFHGKTPNHQALTLATICDQYIEAMANPAQDGIYNHGIDRELVHQAKQIWESACTYTANGKSKNPKRPHSEESLFLAHVNMFDDLSDMLLNYEEFDEDDIFEMLTSTIPKAYKFVERGSTIGRNLHDLLVNGENDLCYYMGVPAEDLAKARGSHEQKGHRPTLTLVPGPRHIL